MSNKKTVNVAADDLVKRGAQASLSRKDVATDTAGRCLLPPKRGAKRGPPPSQSRAKSGDVGAEFSVMNKDMKEEAEHISITMTQQRACSVEIRPHMGE